MNERRIVNVLWTGGLDSSFRVIELSQMDVIIQPYYIIDNVRKSLPNEIKAINKITDIIRSHPRTKATLLDLKRINLRDIKPNLQISRAFNRLHERYTIGHQYELISRFAAQNGLRLEMGLEKSNRSKAYNSLLQETKLEPFKDGEYEVYRVKIQDSSEDGILIYSNIDFPCSLWNMTKQDEVNKLKELGHQDTIQYTWFCHFPILGMPCGHCNPCRDSIKEGLSYRVSKLGYLLYYFYKPFYSIMCRIKRKHN